MDTVVVFVLCLHVLWKLVADAGGYAASWVFSASWSCKMVVWCPLTAACGCDMCGTCLEAVVARDLCYVRGER